MLAKWVEAFCSSRSASVVVNGKTSRVMDLPQAGLPQRSPHSCTAGKSDSVDAFFAEL